ncbi:SusF/SusE family outer membrane protein [Bacteroides acidifaciens]|uniref:SusF/SusE family outer membrane protein n=1 Tax=Bacteroides acidifaciens TaxID=85831 RepID=UPI00158869E0|nr:SusF/SusE family outer membrane protein [Bacteroides acidifaciens]MDE6821765.1 SusF/SusE family outer membrane protein [Bacteroides acidifaciens]
MKKPFNILLATTFALPLFMACETDTDSNPVLNEPDTFTLNTPAYAANNVYDLKNAKSVELTCCQPDYGFPAATTYKVHASFDQEFTEATEEAKANYTELETIHSTARMNVNASELNNALLDLWTAVNGEQAELPAQPIAVYIRLKANISGSNKGECVSNVIGLPNVLISKSTGSLAPPKTMFIVGSMLDAAWKVWKPMAGVYGMDGQFYSMIYFDANSEFKFGTKENEYIGINDNRVTVADKAGAGISGNDNFVVENAGWYLFYVKAVAKGDDYQFTITFYPAEVYLFGSTTGDSWAFTDEWKFAVPATKDGNFVSPAMTASGEVRMCFKTDLDWWRTEFTLHDGEIFYRDFNLINSWTEKGDGYAIQGAAGDVIELNFTAGTGEKK